MSHRMFLIAVAVAVTMARNLQAARTLVSHSTRSTPGRCEPSYVNTTVLDSAVEWIDSMPNYIDSFQVTYCDREVVERFYNNYSAHTLHDLQSATKTLTSALVAIMMRKGAVSGMDQKVSELLPARYAPLFVDQKATITLRHLFTMTSGLAWTDFGVNNSFEQIAAAADSVSFILKQPLVTAPGSAFHYNTGSSHLLSAVVHYNSGMTTTEFAERELFALLGIENYVWDKLRDGVAQGGWGLYLAPTDFIKLSQIYRDGGVYNATRIIDESFADAAIVKHVSTNYTGESYGLQMWIVEDFGPYPIAGARGWGGQDAFVMKHQGMSVAFTGSIEQPGAMQDDVKMLMKSRIVPSFVGPDCDCRIP